MCSGVSPAARWLRPPTVSIMSQSRADNVRDSWPDPLFRMCDEDELPLRRWRPDRLQMAGDPIGIAATVLSTTRAVRADRADPQAGSGRSTAPCRIPNGWRHTGVDAPMRPAEEAAVRLHRAFLHPLKWSFDHADARNPVNGCTAQKSRVNYKSIQVRNLPPQPPPLQPETAITVALSNIRRPDFICLIRFMFYNVLCNIIV